MTYLPKLLAPEFSTHTPESFHAHVSALKRIPQRSAKRKGPPKLPRLSGKLQAKARLYELSAGKTMYPLSYALVKEGRKSAKVIASTAIDVASQLLLQPRGAIVAHLEKKKFRIEGAVTT